ncbi:larval cuticle protein A2B-like [Planococcus citri]|uniref:larval cuticle protein A2B-like n=1 Tax=Planococcus citri TaxID=170843 RepID=UPI0031F9C2E1
MILQILIAFLSIHIPSSLCITPAYYAAPAPVYSYAIPAAPKAAVIHTPITYAAEPIHPDVEKIDPNPSYHFKYGVNDPSTGDYKSQEEYRKDGIVQGTYSLAEPDGTIRTVHYTADHINGFNAVVDRHSAKAVHAVPAVHAAPVVHTAPVVPAKYHAVVSTPYYSAPAVSHVVPALHYASPYPYKAPYAYAAYHR